MITITNFLILVSCIITHELGHYLAALKLKFKPKIRLTWYGVIVHINKIGYVTGKQMIIIYAMGIWFGLIPLIIFKPSQDIYYMYFILCSLDFSSIIGILDTPKHIRKLELWRILKWQSNDVKNA